MCHAYNIQYLVVVIDGVETNADTNHPNNHNQYPIQVQYGTVYEPAPSDRGWLAGLIGKKLKDGAKKNLRKTQGKVLEFCKLFYYSKYNPEKL